MSCTTLKKKSQNPHGRLNRCRKAIWQNSTPTIHRTYLNIIKAIYYKPTANIIIQQWKAGNIPAKNWNKTRMPTVTSIQLRIGIPWLSFTYMITSKLSSWRSRALSPHQPQIPTFLPPGHPNILPAPTAHCAFPCRHFTAHPVVLFWALPKGLSSWQTPTWFSNFPSKAKSFVKSSLKPTQI